MKPNKLHILVDEKKTEQEVYDKKLPSEIQDTISRYNPRDIDWHKYNLAKTKEKQLFCRLLYELCSLIPEPPQTVGRPKTRVADAIFALGLKLYTNFSGRRITSDLKHSEALGYMKKAPHYNTLFDFLKYPETTDILSRLLQISALPLKNLEEDFSMDSSGFGAYQYERWMQAKFKNKRGWRNYLKGHIIIGTRTNIIINAVITAGNASDPRQAPDLLTSLSNFNPKSVSADKAYSSYRIHQIIESLGAMPFIPFRGNANPNQNSAPEIWIRMFRYYNTHRVDFMKVYHRRSNVETVFSMIKVKLGEFLKCRNEITQRNELLLKFICHNICCLISEIFESNIHVDFKQFIEKLLDKYPSQEQKGLIVERESAES